MSNSELLAWPFFGYAPGHYSLTCVRCKETHLDWCAGKRAISCLECAVIAAKEHIAELEADRTQLDELRAALEPFAAVAGKLSSDLPDDTPVTLMLKEGVIYVYALSRFRQARKALGGTNPEMEKLMRDTAFSASEHKYDPDTSHE